MSVEKIWIMGYSPQQVEKLLSVSERGEKLGANTRSLGILYSMEEETVRKLLPEPLKPGSYMEMKNVAVATFIDYPKSNYTDQPYKEFAVWLPCKYKDIEGIYSPYMWLTEDEAMILGREILGHPKKIGKVEVTKRGDEVVGTCERMGIRIATGRLKLEGPAPESREPFNILTLKAIPKSDYSGYEIKQLVCIPIMPGKATENMMGSKAEIVYKESEYDPVYEMKPVQVLGGTWTVGSHTYHEDAYVIYDYLE